jgi:hypothetical protein
MNRQLMAVSDKEPGIGRPEWGSGFLTGVFLQIGRAYGAENRFGDQSPMIAPCHSLNLPSRTSSFFSSNSA